MSKRSLVPAIPPSPAALHRAFTLLSAVRDALLATDPTIADDPQLLHDMLEGEAGSALEVLARVVRASIDADDLADAAKSRKQAIGERQARFERRREALRNAALMALQALDLPRLEQPDFTASVGISRDKVLITDEKALPRKYTRTIIEPDREAIGEALRANVRVPGAMLSNGTPTLTIRGR